VGCGTGSKINNKKQQLIIMITMVMVTTYRVMKVIVMVVLVVIEDTGNTRTSLDPGPCPTPLTIIPHDVSPSLQSLCMIPSHDRNSEQPPNNNKKDYLTEMNHGRFAICLVVLVVCVPKKTFSTVSHSGWVCRDTLQW